MRDIRHYDEGPGFFGYIFRLLSILVFLGGVGFLAFAYFGDLSRVPQPVSMPVDLNGN